MAHEALGFDKPGWLHAPLQHPYLPCDSPGMTAEFWIDFDETSSTLGSNGSRREAELHRYELPRRAASAGASRQYCDYKPVCKLDDKQGVTDLSGSGAVAYAQEIYGKYDFNEVWEGVTASWEA